MSRISYTLLLLMLMLPGHALSRPNVVLILADDLGAGDIGAYGATSIATPSIDRLAALGIQFTQAYASANICTPSRAGLMTGRYAIRSGLGWDVVQANDEKGLPASERTLAELFLDAGYATGLVGKWHLGSQPEYWPTRHGFEYFYGVPHSNDMPDFALYEAEQEVERPVYQPTLTPRFTAKAVTFIRDHAKKPFFLMLSHTAPHIPLHVSSTFAGKSKAGLYGDVVEEIDWSTGQVLSTLKSLDLLDNTIVVFTSDNGAWFEGSGGALRGTKGTTYEGAYRVPLLVSWPGKYPGQVTTDAMTTNLDLLPTLAAAAGINVSALALDGRDLSQVILESAPSPHEYLLYFNNEDIVAIRNQRFKLLNRAYYRKNLGAMDKFSQIDGFTGDYGLLFDLNDPHPERYSLARENPEVVADLTSQLEVRAKEFDTLRRHEPDRTYPR